MNDARKNWPDFAAMLKAYQDLSPGPQAELRRAATPEELLFRPAFYHLCQGRTGPSMQRVIFILPYIKTEKLVGERRSAGEALALADDGDTKGDKKDRLTPVGVRLTRIQRMDDPQDIIELRRLIKHLEPAFNWEKIAWTLMNWEKSDGKQQLLTDYFRHKYAPPGKGKSK